MKQTLLQRAKKSGQVVKEPDKEMIELALAWVRGEVGVAQVCRAVYGEKAKVTGKTSQVYVHLARALKAHLNRV